MKFLKVLGALTGFAVIGATAVAAAEVRQVAEIKAAPAAVWAKIGGWCAIKDWHPAIAACDAGKKGFRTLTLKDGGKIVEKLTKTGKNSYSYDIIESPLPVKNYSATLAAKADSLGTTDLTWTAKFEPAKGKTEADATAVIKGIFEAGLKNIKDNVKMDAPAAAAAAPAAAGTAVAAATAAVTDKEAAKIKAREERRQKFEAAKLAAMEKYAKFKAAAAEKAKAAADAAKAAYEKAKTAMTDAMKKMEAPKKLDEPKKQ
jgi:hypothetical protein